jgi:arsenite methyltransferase
MSSSRTVSSDADSSARAPDKPAAAVEFARLLRPGARLGLTDVTVTGCLAPELSGLAAWVACIADARLLDAYARLLRAAGLPMIHRESHDTAIGRMLEQIEARLALLRITGAERLAAAQLDPDAVVRYLDLARRAVADEIIGYALLVAEKP